jgi:hypothetical protein
MEEPLRRQFPSFGEQLRSLETARARPRTPLWRNIETVYGECLSALYDGEIDERTAWQRLEQGLEPISAAQRDIDNIRKNPSGAETRSQIRRILDQPFPSFSCEPFVGDDALPTRPVSVVKSR